MTPYERVFDAKPDVSHLRVFGSTVYAKIPEQKRKKLDPKAVKGIFVGYPEGSKGYKIYLPERHEIMRCRDVKFVESKFCSEEVGYHGGGAKAYLLSTDVGGSEGGRSEVSSEVEASGSIRDEDCRSLLRNREGGEEYLDRDTDSEEDGETFVHADRFPSHRPVRRRRSPNRFGEWAALAITNAPTPPTISEPKTYKQAIRSSECES